MNIDKAVEFSCEHFVRNLKPGSDTYKILSLYAKEELELKGDDVNEYAMSALNGLRVETEEDARQFYRFYIWYYINYVIPPPPQFS